MNRVEADLDWQNRYSDMIVTPEEAVSNISPGNRVFVGTGCGEPKELVKALVKRSSDLSNIEIVQLLTLGDAPYLDKEVAHNFRVNSFFISDSVRETIQEGLGIIPLSFSLRYLVSSHPVSFPSMLPWFRSVPPIRRGCAVLGYQSIS